MSPGTYRALVSHLGVAPEEFAHPLYVVDRVGRVVFCNRALAELAGYRVEDVVGKLSLLLYTPEAAPAFLMRRVHYLLGHAVPRRLPTQMRRSDGGIVPVELSVTSLVCEGEIIGRVTVVREASSPVPPRPAQAGVEHLLHLSQEEADELPYGLIVLDPTGVIVGYNEAESRLSGLARSAVIGRNFFLDIAPCTGVRAFAGLYRQMAQTGKPADAQFDFVFRFSYGEKRVSIRMAYSRETKQGVIAVEQRPGAAT